MGHQYIIVLAAAAVAVALLALLSADNAGPSADLEGVGGSTRRLTPLGSTFQDPKTVAPRGAGWGRTVEEHAPDRGRWAWRKIGAPWTEEEHALFLRGLEEHAPPSYAWQSQIANKLLAGRRSADEVNEHWREWAGDRAAPPNVASPVRAEDDEHGPTGGFHRATHALLTSWYSFNKDPQRGNYVKTTSIDYIYNLYATATKYGVPLVVFHDGLTDDFVARYTNEFVSFERVAPDPAYSTNDYRFFPYLKYIEDNALDSVLMVDASDVFLNSDPFDYIRAHEGPQDQLFMSHDVGTFSARSWRVPQCYGNKEAHSWPKKKMYNAGVWGGKGPAVQCVLECVTDQVRQLSGRGNCNMAIVNYCVNHGPCQDVAPIHQEPKFVNPFRQDCENPAYSVVHNKCPDTQYGRRVQFTEDGRVVLAKIGINNVAQRRMARMKARRDARTGRVNAEKNAP